MRLMRIAAGGLCWVLFACGGKQSLGENTGGQGSESGGDSGSGGSAGRHSDGHGGLSGGVLGRVPYPLAPTVPIDPNCECADASLVCNAASECVPRCDADGDCARWLIPRAAASLWLEGKSLYILGGPEYDFLNNPVGVMPLLRIDVESDAPPELVGEIEARLWSKIVGRRNGVTYVDQAQKHVLAVADDGQIIELNGPEGYIGAKLQGDYLWFDTLDEFQRPGPIWRRSLLPDASPELVLDRGGRGYMSVFVSEPETGKLWFSSDHACSVDPSLDPPVANCEVALGGGDWVTAVRAPYVFAWTDHGYLYRREAGRDPFLLFSKDQEPQSDTTSLPTLWGDYFYSAITAGNSKRLVRFPFRAAEVPVDVVPTAVMTAMGKPQPNYMYVGLDLAVGDGGLFWVQALNDRFADSTLSRYVFHRAL